MTWNDEKDKNWSKWRAIRIRKVLGTIVNSNSEIVVVSKEWYGCEESRSFDYTVSYQSLGQEWNNSCPCSILGKNFDFLKGKVPIYSWVRGISH